ncbi:hypothetical protein, partial [Xanthomonas axonopodis]|uniref:hypothetical protein n=1 Tax=Xanthomonas axonopodis TaxID=53413 RepID=UPI0018316EBE|nr:hypothetical protein [Xanthomonas citri]
RSSGCAPSGPYVREAIEKNQTEGALDRLHTFVIKFLRIACEPHDIEVSRSTGRPVASTRRP